MNETPNELGPENPKQERKTTAQLRAEYDKYRVHQHKAFVHAKSGEHFQVLAIFWDEETNEPHFMYCYSSMTWQKFARPCEEFLQKFHERGTTR